MRRYHVHLRRQRLRAERFATGTHIVLGSLASVAAAKAVEFSTMASVVCGTFTLLCALGLIFRWRPVIPLLLLCTGGCLLTLPFFVLAIIAFGVLVGASIAAKHDWPSRMVTEPRQDDRPRPAAPAPPLEPPERLDFH